MRLGLDFDNTLISYDQLFYRAAIDKGLIPTHTLQEKNAVRNYLRGVGNEDAWTSLQGEVYGGRILEAEAFSGMLETLKRLSNNGIQSYIVSHKTKTPYLGPPIDLHDAARAWLTKQGFHSATQLNWSQDQIFFEPTKQAKIERIQALDCTHFVDDLPEILAMLPNHIQKILFDPNQEQAAESHSGWRTMTTWQELPNLLKLG